MKKSLVIFFLVSLFFCGCSYTQYYIDSKKSGETDYTSVSVLPLCNPNECYTIVSMVITIDNKSNKTLEINWNRTLFIDNGQTRGGFMFEGIMYIKRHETRQPDLVFPQQTFSKQLFPVINVARDDEGNWIHNELKQGEYGVSLLFTVDGQEMRTNSTFKIVTTQVNAEEKKGFFSKSVDKVKGLFD